jgi:hypothetical protein
MTSSPGLFRVTRATSAGFVCTRSEGGNQERSDSISTSGTAVSEKKREKKRKRKGKNRKEKAKRKEREQACIAE